MRSHILPFAFLALFGRAYGTITGTVKIEQTVGGKNLSLTEDLGKVNFLLPTLPIIIKFGPLSHQVKAKPFS